MGNSTTVCDALREAARNGDLDTIKAILHAPTPPSPPSSPAPASASATTTVAPNDPSGDPSGSAPPGSESGSGAATGPANEAQQKVDVEGRDKWGQTALHYSAANGHMDCLKFLLDHGADIEATGGNGGTSCHVASFYGRTAILQELLARKAQIESKTIDGRTPLNVAASSGHPDAVSVLLAHKADIAATDLQGKTALDVATELKKDACVVLLLCAAKGVYPSIPPSDNNAGEEERKEESSTAVVVPDLSSPPSDNKVGEEELKEEPPAVIVTDPVDWICGAETKVVKEKEEVKVEARDEDYLAICEEVRKAARNGNIVALKTALEASKAKEVSLSRVEGGAVACSVTKDIVDCRDKDGRTPLHLAAMRGREEVIGVLVAYGANLDAQRHDGYTACHYAAWYGHRGTLAELCVHGADILFPDASGRTALHLAAVKGYVDLIQDLLFHFPGSALVRCVDKDGRTALHVAEHYHFHDCVEVLQKAEPSADVVVANRASDLDVVRLSFGVAIKPSNNEPTLKSALQSEPKVGKTSDSPTSVVHFDENTAAKNGFQDRSEKIMEFKVDIDDMKAFLVTCGIGKTISQRYAERLVVDCQLDSVKKLRKKNRTDLEVIARNVGMGDRVDDLDLFLSEVFA